MWTRSRDIEDAELAPLFDPQSEGEVGIVAYLKAEEGNKELLWLEDMLGWPLLRVIMMMKTI